MNSSSPATKRVNWPEVTLGALLDDAEVFVDGDWVESKDQDPEGDVRLIQLADVGDGFYVDKSARFLTKSKAQELKCTFLKPGDILLARMPDPLGRACIFPGDSRAAVTVVDVCIIRPSPKRVDAGWLKHTINSPEFRQRISGFVTGTTRQRISRGNLTKLSVPLPPLPEQRRIAAILDKADVLRAKRREAIFKLDQLLQSVFLNMFGDPVTNPKGWPEIVFDELVESTKLGLVRSADEFGRSDEFDVPYIRMDAISSKGHLLTEKVQRTRATPAEIRDCSVAYGDLLFNTRNSEELVGKSAVFEFNEPWTFNNNLMRFRFNEKANSLYVLRYLLSRRGRMELGNRKSGTTNVFAIYYKDLKSMPVVTPPKALQDQFATVSREIRSRSILCLSQAFEFTRFSQSLQAAAFSGGL